MNSYFIKLGVSGDAGDMGSIPGLERFPRDGHGKPFPILAWRIPRTEEPGSLESMWSQRVRHN